MVIDQDYVRLLSLKLDTNTEAGAERYLHSEKLHHSVQHLRTVSVAAGMSINTPLLHHGGMTVIGHALEMLHAWTLYRVTLQTYVKLVITLERLYCSKLLRLCEQACTRPKTGFR